MSSADFYNGSWTSMEEIERSLMQASNIDHNSPRSKFKCFKENELKQPILAQFTEEINGDARCSTFAEEFIVQQPKIFGRGQMLKELEKNSSWGYKDRVIEQSMRQVPGLKLGLSDQVFQEALKNSAQFEDVENDRSTVYKSGEFEPSFDQSTINWSNLAKFSNNETTSSCMGSDEPFHIPNSVSITDKVDVEIDDRQPQLSDPNLQSNKLFKLGSPSRVAHMFDSDNVVEESLYVKVDSSLIHSSPMDSSPIDEVRCPVENDLLCNPRRGNEIINKAVNFLELVKCSLLYQPEVCKEFLNILIDSTTSQTNDSSVIERMFDLFRHHPVLAQELNELLPQAFKDSSIMEQASSQSSCLVKPRRCRNVLLTKLLEEKADVLGDDKWSYHRHIFVNWIELLGDSKNLDKIESEIVNSDKKDCVDPSTCINERSSRMATNSETKEVENNFKLTENEDAVKRENDVINVEELVNRSNEENTTTHFSSDEERRITKIIDSIEFTTEDANGLRTSQDSDENSDFNDCLNELVVKEYVVNGITPLDFIIEAAKCNQNEEASDIAANYCVNLNETSSSSEIDIEQENEEESNLETEFLSTSNNDNVHSSSANVSSDAILGAPLGQHTTNLPLICSTNTGNESASHDSAVTSNMSTDFVQTLTSQSFELHQFVEPLSYEETPIRSYNAIHLKQLRGTSLNDVLNLKRNCVVNDGDHCAFNVARSTHGYEDNSSESSFDVESTTELDTPEVASNSNNEEDDFLNNAFSNLDLNPHVYGSKNLTCKVDCGRSVTVFPTLSLSPLHNFNGSDSCFDGLLRPDQIMPTASGVNPEEVKEALEKLEKLN